MKLSIIIPCFNEERRIRKTIPKIFNFLSGRKQKAEIVLVNDGSTDNTLKEITTLIRDFKKVDLISFQVINYSPNQGKGFAIKKGILAASGNQILLCDADLSVPIEQLDRLLEFIGEYELVIGSRRQKGAKIIKSQPPIRVWLGKLFSFASKVVLGVKVNDFTCGFKLIKKGPAKKIAKKMKINRWAYDSELLKIATIAGYKIKEVGVPWKNNPGTKVRLSTDIMTSLFDLIRIVLYAAMKRYD